MERIEQLSKDSLKTRPVYKRIYEPSGKDVVSSYPVEWLQKRLAEIEKIEKDMRKEKADIKKEISRKSK